MIDPIFSKPVYIGNIEYNKNFILNKIKEIDFKKITLIIHLLQAVFLYL